MGVWEKNTNEIKPSKMRLIALLVMIQSCFGNQAADTNTPCELASVVNTLRICARYCTRNYKKDDSCVGLVTESGETAQEAPSMENMLKFTSIPFCADMYDTLFDRCM